MEASTSPSGTIAHLQQARHFLHRLDPEASSFTFQTFDDVADRKEPSLARVIHGDLKGETVAILNRFQRQRAGVFVTVNETDGQGRQAHNILRVRAVFVDLDGAPLDPVLKCGLEPHIVCESSPGRFHAYWLTDNCRLDQFTPVQMAIAARFNGDDSVKDVSRVMRIPGFRHFKGGEATSKLLEDLCSPNVPPYSIEEIIERLQLDLSPPERKSAPNGDAGKIQPGNRHSHLFALGRSMSRRSTREAVKAALAVENEARCDPPLPERDIDILAARAFDAKHAHDWQEAPAGDAEIAGDVHAKADIEAPWPDALAPEALHGIAGEFVRMIEPATESDPAAILLQFLVSFGALIGRGPFYRVEATNHHANLFVLLIGATSKARKGTSWDRVRHTFESIASWKPHVSGLSSGEGLKYNVRDPKEETKTNKKGELVTEITDNGVEDKRLLVTESEFASALRSVQRQGNTLSPTVREAWDSGHLRTLTKNDPITATGAHISIIGHIVADELRAELTATDCANGFANRFLFVAVKRSKLLPFGGEDPDQAEAQAMIDRLGALAATARARARITLTAEARNVWAAVYGPLSAAGEGLHGSVTARGEAQCVRLALVYALLDGAEQIDAVHLEAALAVWTYCEATARHIFGDSLGDRVADEILRRLRSAGSSGMSRTDISQAFGRNVSADRIGAALDLLAKKGRAYCETVETRGRPAELWKAKK